MYGIQVSGFGSGLKSKSNSESLVLRSEPSDSAEVVLVFFNSSSVSDPDLELYV